MQKRCPAHNRAGRSAFDNPFRVNPEILFQMWIPRLGGFVRKKGDIWQHVLKLIGVGQCIEAMRRPSTREQPGQLGIDALSADARQTGRLSDHGGKRLRFHSKAEL